MSLDDQIPEPASAPHGRGASALRNLLGGADGSDAAGAAASFAIRLAGTADSHVTLLHACPDLPRAEHAAHAANADALLAAAENRVAESAEWQRRLLNLEDYAAEGADVRSRVVRGRPAGSLLSASKELDSDVILLGSTGVGSLRGRFLGSVSSQVVDHAHCSVMVFREGQTSAPAHVASVVVGVDGSKAAGAAIAAGRSLAAALDTKLVLVAAYRPLGRPRPVHPPTPSRAAAARGERARIRARSGGRRDGGDRRGPRGRSAPRADRRVRTPRPFGPGRGHARPGRFHGTAARQHLALGAQPRAVPGARGA
jgi:nucleotide-binding universal stress UspA family protein